MSLKYVKFSIYDNAIFYFHLRLNSISLSGLTYSNKKKNDLHQKTLRHSDLIVTLNLTYVH